MSAIMVGAQQATDLTIFLKRARRADPAGAVRLVAAASTLAVYVAPLPEPISLPALASQTPPSAGPILGMRVMTTLLPPGVRVDVTTPIAAIIDRLARAADSEEPVRVPMPPMTTAVAWAGVTPPRSGWGATGSIPVRVLTQVARTGIANIAAGTGSGALAVHQLRAHTWGAALPDVPLPAGVAFAADVLGFLTDDNEEARLYQSGSWRRLSMSRGHIVTRPALL
ncbi:MAG: hypothetical protein ACRCTR_06870 [Actinomycetota bacterium]